MKWSNLTADSAQLSRGKKKKSCPQFHLLLLYLCLHQCSQIHWLFLATNTKVKSLNGGETTQPTCSLGLRHRYKEQPKPGRIHTAGSSWLVKLKLIWGADLECYTRAVRRVGGDLRMVTNLLSCRWQNGNLTSGIIWEKKKKKPSVHFCNRRTQKTAMKLRAVTSKFIFCSGEINSLAQERSVNYFGAFMSV